MYEQKPPFLVTTEGQFMPELMLKALFGQGSTEVREAPFGYVVKLKFDDHEVEVPVPVIMEKTDPLNPCSPEIKVYKCGFLMEMLDHIDLAKTNPNIYLQLHGETPLYEMIQGRKREKPKNEQIQKSN